MVAEELKVVVRAEVAKAVSNLKKFQGQTTKTAKTSKKFGGTLGDMKVGALALAGGLTAAIAVLRKVGQATSVWITAASDAEEIGSKFATTFDEVGLSANFAAKELASGFGIANSTAKELLSNTGDMLSGFGATDSQALKLSTRVQTLAIDLASFTNFAGGAAGASDALTKGLLGERESMKSLGIAIQEADVKLALFESGQDKLTGTALRMARAEVTLDLAYQQSQNSLGDYERTQDSFANVTRRSEEVTKGLREELGRHLIPVATKVKTVWAEVIGRMAEAIKHSNDLRDAIAALDAGEELEIQQKITVEKEKIRDAEIELVDLQHQVKGLAVEDLRIAIEGADVALKNLGIQGDLMTAQADQIRGQRALNVLDLKNKEILVNTIKAAEEKIELLREEEFQAVALERLRTEHAANKKAADEAEITRKKEILALTKSATDQFLQIAGNSRAALNLRVKMLDAERKLNEIEIARLQAGADRGILGEDELELLSSLKLLSGAQLEVIIDMNKEWRHMGAGTQDMPGKVRAITDELDKMKDKIEEIRGEWSVSELDRRIAIFEEQELWNAAIDERDARMEASMKEQVAMYKTLGSAVTPILTTMGEAIANTEIGWKDIGKTAIQSIAAILRGLGEQAAIQAAVAYASLNIPGGIAYTAASAAAFIASGAVSAAAGQITTAATGANFVTSGPQLVMVGDNPGGREQVSVTPLSSPNRNGPGGSVVIQINAPVYGVADLYKKLSVVGAKLSNRGRL